MTSVEYISQPATYRSDIRRLLTAANESFLPPLTDPSRAEMSRASGQAPSTDIDSHVDGCVDRPMVGALDGDQLVGFASFEPMVDSEPLADYTPTNHLTVLVVDEAYRNQGLATDLYGYLFESLPPNQQQPAISTKTWSTNDAHLAILDSLDFTCVASVKNDRAPGVDTVYYARRIE